jgi:hypothetical protein
MPGKNGLKVARYTDYHLESQIRSKINLEQALRPSAKKPKGR